MKRFASIVLGAALGVGLPAMATAQDRDHDRGREWRSENPRPAPAQPGGEMPRGPGGPGGGRDFSRFGAAPRPDAPPTPQAPPTAERPHDFGNRGPDLRGGEAGRFAGGAPDRRWDDGRRDPGRPGFDDRRRFEDRGRFDDPRRFDGDRRADTDRRFDGDRRWAYDRGDQRWAGNNWRADRRYDWRGYREVNRGAFHVGRYIPPRDWGYGYRRFSIGVIMPSYFWGQNYWLSDPWDYRLPPAYGPYRWVRYYDDVVLIDIRTGRVVDMIPDFFW